MLGLFDSTIAHIVINPQVGFLRGEHAEVEECVAINTLKIVYGQRSGRGLQGREESGDVQNYENQIFRVGMHRSSSVGCCQLLCCTDAFVVLRNF